MRVRANASGCAREKGRESAGGGERKEGENGSGGESGEGCVGNADAGRDGGGLERKRGESGDGGKEKLERLGGGRRGEERKEKAICWGNQYPCVPLLFSCVLLVDFPCGSL